MGILRAAVLKTSLYETSMKVFHKRSFMKHPSPPLSPNAFMPIGVFHIPFHNQSFTT
jgi:hypothetical protein